VRRFTPNEVERVQGFPDDWTLPRDMESAQAERIDSLRYHAVGNAVTPQVAEWVGRRLIGVMDAAGPLELGIRSAAASKSRRRCRPNADPTTL